MGNRYKKSFKHITIGFLLMMLFGLYSTKAQWSNYNGMPIAYWDFQNTAVNPTTFQTTVKQAVNAGNTFDGKFGGVSTTASGVTGDGIAVYGGSYAGKALSAGGWSNVTTDPGASATTYYQFSINTTGFTGIQIGLDVKASGASYPYSGLCYSTNGGTTWTAGTAIYNGTGWYYAAAYTLPSAADNNANVKIRIYGWWSNNSTGSTLIIDNLMVLASGTKANAGTLNLLNEQDIITSFMPGFTGYSNRTNFTVVGPGTNVVVNNNYNSVYGAPYYSEIGMSTNQTFAVTSSGTVTFGSMGDIASVGKFTLNSGCTLATTNPNGISANGNNSTGNGSVICSGTKTFDPAGNYTFNGTSAQITNGGLPTSLTGNLTINNSAGVTLSNSLTTSGTINLTNGGLILNGNTLSVTNTSLTAITSVLGYIQSETNSATNPSTVTFSMASGNPLTYIYPFGSGGSLIPFTFTKNSSSAVNVTVSTRHTGADNTPWAGASDGGTVAAVGNMVCGSTGNATTSVIDRWWDIYASGAVNADVTFSYLGSEDATMNSGFQIGTVKAQHWNGTSWDAPVGTGVGTNIGIGTCVVTGVSSFSPWVLVASGNPLPIELVNFAASCNNNKINLEWTTATEINNNYFTIQRSPSGENFEDLMRIGGSGNSNEIRNYSTMDNAPLSGMSYYRLKQTDYNGNFSLSPVVVSDCGVSGFNIISVITNQESRTAKLYFSTSVKTNYNVTVYDLLGNKVFSSDNYAENGTNEVEINGSGLSHSIYFIVLSSDKQVLSRKIVF